MSLQIETRIEHKIDEVELSREEELILLELQVFGMPTSPSDDGEVSHVAWVFEDDSHVARVSRLILDGEETDLSIRQFNGWGLDMPGFQIVQDDRLIYQGTLGNAIEAGVNRAEKNQKTERTVGTYASKAAVLEQNLVGTLAA